MSYGQLRSVRWYETGEMHNYVRMLWGKNSGADAPVNINTATLDELDTLPGVGPTTAQAIIDHRTENGPFASVDQLLDVRGIGDAKLAELRDRVVV